MLVPVYGGYKVPISMEHTKQPSRKTSGAAVENIPSLASLCPAYADLPYIIF